jgi:hypothetical protein
MKAPEGEEYSSYSFPTSELDGGEWSASLPGYDCFIIIISGSAVLVRTLAASHWRFRNLIKTLGRTPFDE